MQTKASFLLCTALFLCAAFLGSAPTSEVQAGILESFDQADLFFEENTTDEDLGIHFDFDARSWRRVLIFGPDFSLLANLSNKENLRQLGLTQVAAESAEPNFFDMPRQAILDLFPPGPYLFVGVTKDGDFLISETMLTHAIPEGTTLLSPQEDSEVDPAADLLIQWAPVPDPNPPFNVIEFYEIIVEKDEDGERTRVFSVDMKATDTSVRCPREFFEAGKDYKVEIISEETTGNRSSTEVPFSTLE